MLDILLISHNRLEYLIKAIEGIKNQTFKDWTLTIWDNGSDKKTVDWLIRQEFGDNIRLICSNMNDNLADVISAVFSNSDAEFVGKVDSDTIVPPDWAERLIEAHKKCEFGFLGGIHFKPEDMKDIEPNIETVNGVSFWRKPHIGGCAFIIRREIFKPYSGNGLFGMTEYQHGFKCNAFLWNPPLWVELMDDTRSEHCIKDDEYKRYLMKTRGQSIEEYTISRSNNWYLRENGNKHTQQGE